MKLFYFFQVITIDGSSGRIIRGSVSTIQEGILTATTFHFDFN